MTDFGACRSCKAPVIWARSAKTGKAMPLQDAPEDGNVIVDGFGKAHVFADHAAAIVAMETLDGFPYGETLLSHHAVCPNRGEWSHAPGRQTAKQPAGETLF
jgi:hypothetical protein